MTAPVSQLAVTENRCTLVEDQRVGWLRHRGVERTTTFLDWTIDGRPLREHVPFVDGRVPDEATVLQNERTASGVGRASLITLLDLPGRSEFDVRMPDGRVALLFCRTCFDLSCATLTAEVVATSDGTVEWRDVAWQVGYEPLDLGGSEFDPPTFVFDAAQYRALLRRLLVEERVWTDARPS